MYLTQCINRSARATPDRIVTRCAGRETSWKQFQNRVSRLAGGLGVLGVKSGDRVAILALNSDRYLEFLFAGFWGGAVVVPMNLRWSASENAYSLNDSGAETLLVDDAFLPMVPAILAEAKGVKTLIYMGDGETPENCMNFEEIVSQGPAIEDANRGGNDLAGLFYTGGTTGFPKGVMLSHLGLWSSAVANLCHARLDENMVYLHAAPMFHLADGTTSLAAMLAGGEHVFVPAFKPAAVISAIEDYGVTETLLVPTMVKMMIDDPTLQGADLSSLKQIIYGGSAMSEGLLREAMQKLPGVKWYQGYGQTETSPLITYLPPEYHVFEGKKSGKSNSAGITALCNEVKIVDPDGTELPIGEVGEVLSRGPNAMLGYWNKPDQTTATIKNGWTHTGDLAYMDKDGFVFITDRVKDMIISGGENVFSIEVENAISIHPAVSAATVFGIPSKKWGEAVHAVVVPVVGAEVTAQEITDHCRALIAHYKCPSSVEFRTEPLPLSGAGKVLKRDLRAPFWTGKTRGIN